MDLKKLEYQYWTAFNFLVRRIMGILWLTGGGLATLWSLSVLLDQSASISIEGVPSTALSVKLLGVLVSSVVTIFGWVFLRIPKYYPPRVQEWMREQNLDDR